VYVYGFQHKVPLETPIKDFPAIDIKRFPYYFGNAAYLFCIHSVVRLSVVVLSSSHLTWQVIPIEQSMENPRRSYFTAVNASTAIVCVVNILFATLCYLFFGAEVKGIS
jgi:hypothetical protein